MRLETFALHHYGPFEDLSLDLDPRPGRINLLLAGNGHGKSVLRQAIHDLLFGIHGQTPMGFRFGYAGMRLMATARADDGGSVAFGRRKGQRNTLIDAEGRELDPAVLRGLIGSADDGQFERLFAMDTERLRSGAEKLLASDGDLGEALFAAAGGSADLRRVLDGLEAERDEMAPLRRSAGKPLHRELDAWQAARRALDAARVMPAEWKRRADALAEARKRREELAREDADCRRAIAGLERVRRIGPFLRAVEEARAAMAAAEGAPRLAGDLEARWRAGLQARGGAAIARDGHTKQVAGLEAELAEIAPDRTLLAARERIEALRTLGIRIAADHRDLPRRQGERQMLLQGLRADRTALGLAGEPGEGPALPDAIAVKAARELARRHDRLSNEQARAAAALRAAEEELGGARALLAAGPAVADVDGLRWLVGEALRGGHPADRLAGLEAEAGDAAARLRAAVARVRGWSGDAEALAALAVPPKDTLAAAAAELKAAGEADARAMAEVEAARGRLEDLTARLDALRAGPPLPDPAAVNEARARRDHGWELVRALKFDGTRDAGDPAVAAFAVGLGLPGAFEQAVRDADALADRRDGESRRLAEVAALEQERAGETRRLAGLIETAGAAAARHRRATGRWGVLAEALGLPADTGQADVTAFIDARERAIEWREDAEKRAHAVARERRAQDAAAARLAAAMGVPAASLAGLLAQAEGRVAASETAAKRAGELAQAVQAAERAERDRRRESQAAAGALEAWQADWDRALHRLGRPEGEGPAVTETALDLIEAVRRRQDELTGLDHRIAGMEANIRDFEAERQAVLAGVAPDLAALPSDRAMPALLERLKQATDAATTAETIAGQLDRAREAAATAQRALDAADAALAALLAEIGAADAGEADARLSAAAVRRAAEQALETALAGLRDAGDGLAEAELRAEVAAHGGPDLDQRLEVARDREHDIDRQRQEAAQAVVRLEQELAAAEHGEGAIEAEQGRQAALASLDRIATEALRLDLAARLLRAAMQRLRAAEDDGLVGRIGAAFAGLTGGAFSTVATQEGRDGSPELCLIQPDDPRGKRVGELSEGTRDQLYLAMRLVMLRDYAARAPMLPFVADDLLQTFDDARSRNALAALIDLSDCAQVILLTHHRHVRDIAAAAFGDRLHVCTLPAA